ncbi:MAG TPA: two-component regulator propeller domain-containing protein, partial [Flavisolibacter sp.]|nr:two-component regulator propeller domain-containing protein [Flavisolibacter sp.]
MSASRNIYALLIAIVFNLACPDVFAQLPDYHLQLFDNTSGMRPGSITAVARDKKGFLWILYPRQVQRFDGSKIESFKPEGPLTRLFCDDADRVWVCTAEKVFLFDQSIKAFTEVPVPAHKPGVSLPLFQTPDRKIWVLTPEAIYPYDASAGRFSRRALPLPLQPSYSTRVFGHLGYSIFLGHEGHIFRIDIRTGRKDSLPDLKIKTIFPLHGDSALVSTWDGTSHWYNFASGRITDLCIPGKPSPTSAFFGVRSMLPFAPGRFFMAANTGIYEYNSQLRQFRRLHIFLNGRKVATNDYANYIHLDHEGYAWLATVDGVGRIPVNHQPIGLLRIRQPNDEMPVAVDNVRKMVEDKNGNLWLATGHGFVCWNRMKEDWEFFLPAHDREDRLSFPSIRGLVYDGKYLILGPTDRGTWLFEPVTRRYRRPDYDSDSTRSMNLQDFVDDIFTLANGNHLILGRDAIYLLNGKNYKMSRLSVPAARENANYGYQGSNGVVWITTNQGLHCLDSNLNHLQVVDLPFKNRFISAGFMLPDNRFLFSSADGLFTAAYNEGKVQLKKFTNQLDGVFVTTLYQDNKGMIWATSENGIYRLDPAGLKLNLFDYS